MRLNTLVLLMSVFWGLLALALVALTVGTDDMDAVLLTAAVLAVSIVVGTLRTRRAFGQHGRLTLAEHRARLEQGTMPPVERRLVLFVRNAAVVALACLGIALPVLWIELGATVAVVVGVLTLASALATWRVFSIARRRSRDRSSNAAGESR